MVQSPYHINHFSQLPDRSKLCPPKFRPKIFVGPNFRHLKFSSIGADEYFGPTKFGPKFDFTKTSSYCIMSSYKFSRFTLKNKVFHISPIFSLKILKNPIFIPYFCPKNPIFPIFFTNLPVGTLCAGNRLTRGMRGRGGDKV